LRELIDVLPPIDGIAALLDDPSALIPRFNPDDPYALCTQFGEMEFIGEATEKTCNFVIDVMPDLALEHVLFVVEG
jgi:hypothetical protein